MLASSVLPNLPLNAFLHSSPIFYTMRSLAWISAVLVACIGCANAAMVRRGFRPPPPPPSPLPKVYECARVEILFIGLPAYRESI